MEKKILNRYLNVYLPMNKKRENTISSYTTHLNQMYDYLAETLCLGSEVEIIKATDSEVVEDYMMWLMKQYEDSTVNTKMAIVIGFFQYLLKKDIIEKNPTKTIEMLEIEQKSEVDKEHLDKDELNILLASISTKPKRFKGDFDFISSRDKMIMGIMHCNAVRSKEILSITMDWIEEDDYVWVNIPSSVVKNKIPKRIIIPKELYMTYMEHRSRLGILSDTFIVTTQGKPLARQNLNKAILKHIKNAEINKHISSHSGRTYLVTELKREGYTTNFINELGGWQQESITERYYQNIKALDNKRVEVARLLLPKNISI